MTEPAARRHASLEYRPAIDGLRALAVLSVFIFHLNHRWLPGGFVGVDVFFVISGYLITSIIFKECQNGSFSLKKFYQRRIARIFPAFFTVALATLAGAKLIFLPQDFSTAGVNFVEVVFSIANIKFMSQGNYFVASPDARPFLHYWSLSVEEQFYILFPLLFLLLFKGARRHLVPALGVLCAGSFAASVVMTHLKPVWAFYLLPTRAWQLLAGCLLAMIADHARPSPDARWPKPLSIFSLALIVLSFFLIHEGDPFPGYWALLPVVGAVGVLLPVYKGGGLSEKWLAAAPLVAIGRMSYSLYLWHWPIFSLVDYGMCFASEATRLALKIGLTFLAATLSFWLIENPARLFLNRKENMLLAFVSLACALALSVPLGISIKNKNYVSAQLNTVSRGGVVFNPKSKINSMILMGDSFGSMYGKVLKEICEDNGWKLNVICVDAGDPLPTVHAPPSDWWLDSLALVRMEKPDYLVLSCRWDEKLKDDKQRLALAVAALKPHVGRLVILNQPPLLPENASRAAIRLGVRPPFYEDAENRHRRNESNAYLMSFQSRSCVVVDIASRFVKADGEILFLNERGRQLFDDRGIHLSAFGADLVRPDLLHAVSPPKNFQPD